MRYEILTGWLSNASLFTLRIDFACWRARTASRFTSRVHVAGAGGLYLSKYRHGRATGL